MLYPKSKKLSVGNNTESRIQKMEEQRKINFNLIDNFKRYISACQNMAHFESQIVADIDKLYTNDSMYHDLIHNLQRSVQFKSDIIRRETKNLSNMLDKQKGLEKIFNPLKPVFNMYFKNKDKKEHYEKKLPNLESQMEGKKKIKGQLTNSETKKLVRNQRKTKNSATEYELIKKQIVLDTDKVNLERFELLNPLLKEFISVHTSTITLMQDKIQPLEDYEAQLAQKEDQEYNRKFFLDVRAESRVNLKRRKTGKATYSDDGDTSYVTTQNIQNNYYYINKDDSKAEEERDSVIVMKDSGVNQVKRSKSSIPARKLKGKEGLLAIEEENEKDKPIALGYDNQPNNDIIALPPS